MTRVNDIKVGDTVEVSDAYYRIWVSGRPKITTVTGFKSDGCVWLAGYVGWVPVDRLILITKPYTVDQWSID